MVYSHNCNANARVIFQDKTICTRCYKFLGALYLRELSASNYRGLIQCSTTRRPLSRITWNGNFVLISTTRQRALKSRRMTVFPMKTRVCTSIWSSFSLPSVSMSPWASHPAKPTICLFINNSKTPSTMFFPSLEWNAEIQIDRNNLGKLCWFHQIVIATKRLLKVTTFLFHMKWGIADNAMYFFILRSSKVY